MRKMLDGGVSLRKAFAQGDGEMFYPDGNYDDDAPAGGPATPLGAQTGGAQTFAATGPMGEMVVDGLNKWASGGFSSPDAPGARGPNMPPRRRG